jgi:hypothetical protein
MAEKMQVEGPVKVKMEDTAKEAVAYRLMEKIAGHDSEQKKDRAYWLTLYRQCLKATMGWELKSVLQAD